MNRFYYACGWLAAALLSTSSAAAPVAQQSPAKPVFEYTDIDLAWREAQKQRRPLLVFVTSKNCPHCVKMVRETYSHPVLAHALTQRFETAIFLADSDPKRAAQLGVRAYPTTLAIAPDGRLLGRVEGYVPPKEFANQLLRAVTPSPASRDVATR